MQPRALFLFLGVLSAVLGVSSIGIEARLKFTCDLPGIFKPHNIETHWCGYLTVYDYQGRNSSHHLVLKTDEYCGSNEQWRLKYELSGEGFLPLVNYALSHNCSWNNNMMCVHPKTPTMFPMSKLDFPPAYLLFQKQLLDVGEMGPCKPVV